MQPDVQPSMEPKADPTPNFPTTPDPGAPHDDTVVRNAAFGVSAMLIVVVLYLGAPVILPVVVAVLTTYALEPIVRKLTRLRIPRVAAAAITLLVLFSLLGFTAYRLRNRAASIVASLPPAAQKLQRTLRASFRSPDTPSTVKDLQDTAKEIENAAKVVTGDDGPNPGVTKVQVEAPPFNMSAFLLTDSNGLLGLMGQAMVVSFLVFFLLASGDLYNRKLVRMIGSRLSHKRLTVEALQEISSQIERFLWVQVFTSVLVGFLTWLLLVWMGVENSAVWGLLAGVLNSIPYFGALLVSGGLAVVAFLQFGTIVSAVQVALGAFLITSVEGMLLTPVLLGKVAGVNQVAMFVSLLFWGWIWGVPGTLLAVPIMMVVKTVCERVDGLQGIGEMLDES
ncbi:MAG: AI-2E family transporter [Acidobacteriota bacterium]